MARDPSEGSSRERAPPTQRLLDEVWVYQKPKDITNQETINRGGPLLLGLPQLSRQEKCLGGFQTKPPVEKVDKGWEECECLEDLMDEG